MLRHLFRLIWNRKRANLLLFSEIFFSFIVLFGIGTLLFNFGRNYVLPRGFRHNNIWRLYLTAAQGQKMPRPQVDNVLQAIQALPGVQDAALASDNTPFRFVTMNTTLAHGNNLVKDVDQYEADERYFPTMGLTLQQGRWFRASDDAAAYHPAVLSRNTADALFGPGQPALGQLFRHKSPFGPDTARSFQVVGVAANVRMGSDFSAPTPSLWLRLLPHDTASWETATVLVHVAPGQGAALQQRMVRTVAGPGRQWSTRIYALENDRLDMLKPTLAPLAALALIGLFLVVNVALGLFGVLWYNISQRRAEIGLRRVLGATGVGIGWQFLGEMLVLTTLGVLAGTLVAMQFPLLHAFNLASSVYGLAMLLAAALIFVLTAVCAWQPSRLAAAIQPAVALREE